MTGDFKLPQLPDDAWTKISQMVKTENKERLPQRMDETIRRLMVTLDLKEEKRHERRHEYMNWLKRKYNPSLRFYVQSLELVFDRHLKYLTRRNWGITSGDVQSDDSYNRRVEAYMRTLLSLYLQGLTVYPETSPFIQDEYCTFKPEHRRKIEEASREFSEPYDDDDFVAHLYKDEQVGILYKDILLHCDEEVDEVNTKIQQKMGMMEAGPLYPPSKYFRDMNLDTAL